MASKSIKPKKVGVSKKNVAIKKKGTKDDKKVDKLPKKDSKKPILTKSNPKKIKLTKKDKELDNENEDFLIPNIPKKPQKYNIDDDYDLDDDLIFNNQNFDDYELDREFDDRY